ncbi:hypothetical protein V8E36_001722 [Tilletia maclaganii]
MKFAILSLTFLPAILARAVTTPSRAVCQTLADHGLTNLDRHGCGDVQPMGPIRPEAKDDVCSALHHGGLTNISSLGCTQHFYAVETYRDGKNGGAQFATRAHRCAAPPKCSSSKLCSIMQKGMMNANLMGCQDDDYDFEDDSQCKKKVCQILQSGLILNLNLIGCF